MVKLELTHEEREILAHTLEVVLSDLRMEISKTDRLAFRDMLRVRKEALSRILEQIGGSTAITS